MILNSKQKIKPSLKQAFLVKVLVNCISNENYMSYTNTQRFGHKEGLKTE